MLTAKNRDQLRNPTLDSRVWATLTFMHQETCRCLACYGSCKGHTVRVCLCGQAPADFDRHVLPAGRPAANLPHATAAVDRWDYTENGDTDRHQTVT